MPDSGDSSKRESEAAATVSGSRAVGPDVTLMIEYMNEQYAAARHHQALRAQTTAFLVAASSVLFGRALEETSPSQIALLGYGLLVVAFLAALTISAFYRANRLHSETATACRKLLAKASSDAHASSRPFEYSDPIWVRVEVEKYAKMPGYNPRLTPEWKAEVIKGVAKSTLRLKYDDPDPSSSRFIILIARIFKISKFSMPKIEYVLTAVFFLIPLVILTAGILVLSTFK